MIDDNMVVVTGATRGLGRAMAEEFVRLGWTVIGCGTNATLLDALRGAYGPPHDFDLVDVAEDEAVAGWARRVLQSYRAPDLLLNNAAVINRNGPLWTVKAGEFGRVIDVNIKWVANVVRHFLPAMIRRKEGVVVNFSSGWGRSTEAEVAPYCATKWAIEGMTQALAQELPAGMAAVPFNPGVINTEMLQSCFGSSASQCVSPNVWARKAVSFLVKLGPKDNGRSVSAP